MPFLDRTTILYCEAKEKFNVHSSSDALGFNAKQLFDDVKPRISKIHYWSKFLMLDSDPRKFESFLGTFRLSVKNLLESIPRAINYDTNMECIVQTGMQTLDTAVPKQPTIS